MGAGEPFIGEAIALGRTHLSVRTWVHVLGRTHLGAVALASVSGVADLQVVLSPLANAINSRMLGQIGGNFAELAKCLR
jgi:hypothetical protein